MGRPTKYPFTELLREVGDTFQILVLDKGTVTKIRNAATQWARRLDKKVVTRTMKRDEGIVVTVELVPSDQAIS
jgi:hypothetical protein